MKLVDGHFWRAKKRGLRDVFDENGRKIAAPQLKNAENANSMGAPTQNSAIFPNAKPPMSAADAEIFERTARLSGAQKSQNLQSLLEGAKISSGSSGGRNFDILAPQNAQNAEKNLQNVANGSAQNLGGNPQNANGNFAAQRSENSQNPRNLAPGNPRNPNENPQNPAPQNLQNARLDELIRKESAGQIAFAPTPSDDFQKFMAPKKVTTGAEIELAKDAARAEKAAQLAAKTRENPAAPSAKIAKDDDPLVQRLQKNSAIPDVQLKKIPIEKPNPRVTKRRGMPDWLHDVIGLGIFVVVVVVGAWAVNNYVLQSFNVVGPSSYPTLDGNDGSMSNYPTDQIGKTSDRLIVNLLPVTLSKIQGKNYVPERGQFIVFKNPNWTEGMSDEWVVKRVVGLPGETVKVAKNTLKIYNSAHADGFDPYKDTKDFPLFKSVANPGVCVSGDGTNVKVPAGNIFVVGDNRCDFSVGGQTMQPSEDSRNGNGRPSLGTIPLNMIVGPVALRVWPLDKIQTF